MKKKICTGSNRWSETPGVIGLTYPIPLIIKIKKARNFSQNSMCKIDLALYRVLDLENFIITLLINFLILIAHSKDSTVILTSLYSRSSVDVCESAVSVQTQLLLEKETMNILYPIIFYHWTGRYCWL